MKVVTKDVKSKQKVVGSVDLPVYESLAEIQDDHKEEVIVAKFNKANAVDIMGAERNKHTPSRMGKTKRMRLAYNLITPEEAMACTGDYDKLQELLESKLPEVDAQLATEAA